MNREQRRELKISPDLAKVRDQEIADLVTRNLEPSGLGRSELKALVTKAWYETLPTRLDVALDAKLDRDGKR